MRIVFYIVFMLLPGVAGCQYYGGTEPVAEPLDLELCEEQNYRITYVDMPVNATESKEFSLDVDGDDDSENAYGGIYSALVNLGDQDMEPVIGPALEDRLNRGINSDDFPWLLSLWFCEEGQVAMTLGRGQNASGAGITESEYPGIGEISNGRISIHGGRGLIPLALTVDLAEVVVNPWTVWEGAATDLVIENDTVSGRVGVALSPGYFDLIIPPLTETINHIANNLNPDVLLLFDRNEDGNVTADELAQNSLIGATLGNPDLDMLGDADGIPDSLSFGFQIEAERVDR